MTVATNWREQASRAAQLIAEIKESAREGKDGAVFFKAEDQVEAHNKMAEAQKLMKEAREGREAAEKPDVTGADLEALERAAAQFGTDPGEIGPAGGGSLSEILTGRSGGHARDKAAFNPFKTGKAQLVKASPSVMGRPLFEHVIPERVRESGRELARSAMRENASAVTQREIAALVEGTQANGGFLVVPQYLQEMFAAVRRQGNALRRLGWLNVHQTEETNQVLFPKASGSLTVGLVAELAIKPTADNSYAQVIISLYTMAGIAAISRQLSRSADPAVAQILAKDLALLLGNLEEQLVYSGTGTGQPRGIINTTGTTAVPAATQTALNGALTGQILIDALLDAQASIATTYYGPPTGAIMRPSRLAFLQKTKDTQGNYVLNLAGTFRAPGASEAEDIGGTDTFELIGMPIAQSTNIPSNLGAGTNQDCVIMADWSEAHWFQRWDQQLDSSDIASDGAGVSSFATNRVLFRLEEIAGFSAERYAAAFCVLTGTGMLSAF